MPIEYPKARLSPAEHQPLTTEFRRDEVKRGDVRRGQVYNESDYPPNVSKLAQKRG